MAMRQQFMLAVNEIVIVLNNLSQIFLGHKSFSMAGL